MYIDKEYCTFNIHEVTCWEDKEYCTFNIHEVTCWEDSDDVCDIAPVCQHADGAVLPLEHDLRRVSDGSPRVPNQGLNEACHTENC